MRLIDADALEELFREVIGSLSRKTDCNLNFEYMIRTSAMTIEMIKDAQPIDAVEVVRCKDCKYSVDFYNDGECYCQRPEREMQWISRRWDFFCAAGRKRGDGE